MLKVVYTASLYLAMRVAGMSSPPLQESQIRETDKQYLDFLVENFNPDVDQLYWDRYEGGGLSWTNDNNEFDWKRTQNTIDKPLLFGLANLSANGGVRDVHIHNNADEYTIILQGQARVSVSKLPSFFTTNFTQGEDDQKENRIRGIQSIPGDLREAETFLLNPGDAFYVPKGFSHFFESVDPDEPLVALAAFDTSNLTTFDTPQVVANFNSDILARTFKFNSSQEFDDLNLYNGPRVVISTPHANFSSEVISSSPYQYQVKDLFDIDNAILHPRDNGTKTVIQPQNNVHNFFVAYTEVAPGSWIEPYWIDNGSEYTYVLESSDNGDVVMSIADQKRDSSESDTTQFSIKTGYMTKCTIGYTCAVENNSNETLKLIRFYNVENPSITQLYDAFVELNSDTLASMYQTDVETIEQIKNN